MFNPCRHEHRRPEQGNTIFRVPASAGGVGRPWVVHGNIAVEKERRTGKILPEDSTRHEQQDYGSRPAAGYLWPARRAGIEQPRCGSVIHVSKRPPPPQCGAFVRSGLPSGSGFFLVWIVPLRDRGRAAIDPRHGPMERLCGGRTGQGRAAGQDGGGPGRIARCSGGACPNGVDAAREEAPAGDVHQPLFRVAANMTNALVSPFPWFGGKRAVAQEFWSAVGQPKNYVEPFAGSVAVLLQRPDPQPHHIETINDADGLLANFWRALKHDPKIVSYYAEDPPNEADLHARHLWLNGQRPRITESLMGDPFWYDPRAAGWWVWGQSLWIGHEWCSGSGPWISIDGQMAKDLGDAGTGVRRQSLHLGDAGTGVHRQSLHLGNAGTGVHRQSLRLGNAGTGISDYMNGLATRLRHVRVNCGDWSRVVGPSVLQPSKDCSVAVFLDPPYSEDNSVTFAGGGDVAANVRAWAVKHGTNPEYKIALCTYSADTMPDGWVLKKWKAGGGYGNQANKRGRENASRESLWFSPACKHKQADLFSCRSTAATV